MKVFPMIAAEFRRLFSTSMGRIAFIALGLVPLLYGGVYLWANQDPYANLDQVPVALVNADDGADVDGDHRVIGDEVAEQIESDGTFDWHQVSAADAEAGVEDGTYDFALTLPESFTDDLLSATGDDPHQAQVVLMTNDANSYLATTIGTQAATQIRASVTRAVGEEAASRMLLAISDIRDGMVEAYSGASTLADGLATAHDGSTQLASGAGELATGAQTLSDGTAQLADGTSQLATGSQSLATGLDQLEQQTASLPSQTAQLASGAQQVSDGNARIASIGSEVAGVTSTLADQVPTARADIIAALQQAGLTQAQIDQALVPLDALGSDIVAGDAQVASANQQLQTLASGAQQVADGASALATAAPQMTSAITQASDGADQLAAGTATADAGAHDAAAGAAQLASGASTLSTGANDLDAGIAQLADGSVELRDGLGDGVSQIPETTAEQRADQAKTIADPVDVNSDAVTSAGTYGAGLAPFFVSLAAWIGIYALMLIVKPVSRRAITALRSPVRVGLAAWLTPASIGAVQMLALFGVLAVWLGFTIAAPVAMIAFMVLTTITFAAIIVALNVWLGSVGQFLGLVLMVIQLVTAGGTFPWQTLPAPLAWLHHVMPMSYSVDGLRQIMYGGDAAAAGADAIVLASIALGALVLVIIGVARMMDHRTMRDLQPSLIG